MLILAPFIFIVLVVFAMDMYYFDDADNIQELDKKIIIKDKNKTDNRQNYLDKYLNK